MRTRAIALIIAALFLTEATGAQTLTQHMQRRSALTQPALDGMALGGIRLGDPEAAVTALLGPPEAVESSALAERVLRYELVPDLWLEAHVDPTGVRAIGVRVASEPDALPSPQTMRGIHLGMPIARVLERYGEPAVSRLWYAAEGVAFNVDGPADTVESILIFPRGTPAP